MLLVAGGKRQERLLTSSQCTGRPHTAKSYLTQNVSSAGIELNNANYAFLSCGATKLLLEGHMQ